jgi:hypothetical protein
MGRAISPYQVGAAVKKQWAVSQYRHNIEEYPERPFDVLCVPCL